MKFFTWLKSVYLAVRYVDYDKAEMAQLLEIALKSGRRSGYDLKHAASCLSMADSRAGLTANDFSFTKAFYARAEHYLNIFNAANDMKNYRISLHLDIDRLETKVAVLEKIIEDHNIRTGENVSTFGPDEIPF